MIARQWESETDTAPEERAELAPEPRLREHASPISQLLGQNMLDEAVRALQEDLALLQAEQERSLGSLNGTLEQIGQELGAVRAQLTALAEPLLNGQVARGGEAESERERTEIQLRLERLEKQVTVLMRGMDAVDSLRYQSDVHTRALARLTDLLGEVVRPKPVEGLEPLKEAVTALERSQRRTARFQVALMALLGIGITPGLGALAWLVAQRGGF